MRFEFITAGVLRQVSYRVLKTRLYDYFLSFLSYNDLGLLVELESLHLWLHHHHHHMEKTEAGLKGLCIREIMTKYTLYYTKYYTIILRFPMPWRSAL